MIINFNVEFSIFIHMKTFKDYYKFPLEMDPVYVRTADGQMAFNWLCPDNEILRQDVLDKINGDEHLGMTQRTWSVQPGRLGRVICCDDVPVLLPRGWGMLRGIGGYNLDEETAARIQDEFIEYVVEQLNK